MCPLIPTILESAYDELSFLENVSTDTCFFQKMHQPNPVFLENILADLDFKKMESG